MTKLARSEREQLFTRVLPITYFVLKYLLKLINTLIALFSFILDSSDDCGLVAILLVRYLCY